MTRHLLFLITLIALWNASCSRVRLQPTPLSPAQLSSTEPFYLPPPAAELGPQRYIFFVDMSFSTVSDACPTDVNNNDEPRAPIEGRVVAAKNPGMACSSEGGSDPLAWRLNWIKEWLTDLKTGSMDTKVLILPLTGGLMEIRRMNRGRSGGFFGRPDPVQNGEFVSVADAAKFVDLLKQEHNQDLQAARNKTNNQYLGTSVPAVGLQRISERILGDMSALQKMDLLHAARYEFVLLSDGMPTPTLDHIKTALNLGGCPYSCLGPQGGAPAGPGNCSATCRKNVQEMLEFWGDPIDNRYESIRTRLNAIAGLPRVLGEGRMQMHFIALNSKNIPQRERHKDFNFMLKVRDHFIGSRHLEMLTELPTFRFRPRSGDARTLKMTHFFALNSNARLDATGTLRADSDGDGLSDEMELKLGTDVSKARSANGLCLDLMLASASYRDRCNQTAASLDCDAQLDADGDTLSECEERILGTDPFDFDTDGDGIPDSLELVYSFFPGRNDEKSDSNSDNVTNVSNFEKGLSPALYPSRIPSNLQVQLNKEYLGQKDLVGANGEIVRSEGYQIRLASMPLISPSVIAEPFDLYLSKSKTAASKIPQRHLMISGSGSLSSNVVTYLARVTDFNDPSFYKWYLLKTPIELSVGARPQAMDLSQMRSLPVMDPREQR